MTNLSEYYVYKPKDKRRNFLVNYKNSVLGRGREIWQELLNMDALVAGVWKRMKEYFAKKQKVCQR